MKLVIGLGNPGEKYQEVRHNLGFMVVDELAKRVQATGGSWEYNEKLKSEICHLKTETHNLILAKPQTYMNNSGMAVRRIVDQYAAQIDPAGDLWIIHDELDLPLGKLKIRVGGSAAGHHGVESIINVLGNDNFIRVRLGIGNKQTQSAEHKKVHVDANHFVLESFLPNEKSKVKHLVQQAVDAILFGVEQGVEAAMNRYNH